MSTASADRTAAAPAADAAQVSRLSDSAADDAAGALAGAATQLQPMLAAHLDEVLAVERRSYEFPWSHGNFVDALAAGYLACRLLDGQGRLLGYFVAMQGAGEMHLLNLSVAPRHQRRGHARAMLEALMAECRARGLASLWLEVRAGNSRARRLYTRLGFAEVGLRRGYYPASRDASSPVAGAVAAQREDALVMSLHLAAAP